eukprot:137988-Ditylum_brightwellii.AAC.1
MPELHISERRIGGRRVWCSYHIQRKHVHMLQIVLLAIRKEFCLFTQRSERWEQCAKEKGFERKYKNIRNGQGYIPTVK